MTVVNISKARAVIFKLVKQAADKGPIYIKGKDQDAVLVSAEEWASIEETLHLYAIPGMVESIKKARKEPLKKAKKLDVDAL